MRSTVAAMALAAGMCSSAALAQSDELWEVTSQMSAPGMPAGMGAMTQQVCQEKSSKKPALGDRMENCQVTDFRESGNRITMTVRCPDSTAQIEHTYNAARTEYKGVMKMKSKEGDMTMTTSGRRVGSCDAKVARKKQADEQAAIKSKMDESMAQSAAQMKQMQEEAIRGCNEAPETMEVAKLGMWAQCREQPQLCQANEQLDPGGRAKKACAAGSAKLCARYQTPEGYLKAKGSPATAKYCGVDAQAVKTSLCPKAGKSGDALLFLGRYCPVEAKPIAEQHCAGRDYTAMRAAADKPKDKYHDFCLAYLANADLEEAPRSERKAKPAAKPTEVLQKGVSEGINKLKGLFGR